MLHGTKCIVGSEKSGSAVDEIGNKITGLDCASCNAIN